LANNKLGELVPPAGWKSVAKYSDGSGTKYIHNDGREQDDPPAGSKPEGIIAIANAIPDMGALSKLIFGGDYDSNKGTRPEPATLEVGMTEANFSNKNLGAGGAFIISAWITHKDKGALFSVDVSRNYIPEDKIQELDQHVRRNRLRPVLEDAKKTLTELDLKGRFLDAKDAIVLAEYIKDNGAMTSLNLASNMLYAEGAKIVAEAIKVTKCTPAIILVSFSCPSDFSINCCCLLLSAGYGGDDKLACGDEQNRGKRDDRDHRHCYEQGEYEDSL
jgi:hypothetical protein